MQTPEPGYERVSQSERKSSVRLFITQRLQRQGQQPGEDPPQYYIPRHAEAPVSFIFLRPSGYTDYFEYGSRPERSGANYVELYFNLSPSVIGRDLPHGYMRCSVDGKRASMPGPMPYADQHSVM
ncbi:MAG: hypothetical protein ACR2HX_22430 [Pyrinomonadaceae bacterium]